MVAEAEFQYDKMLAAFAPPLWCGQKVTGRPSLTGASLARMAGMPGSDAATALTAVLAFIG